MTTAQTTSKPSRKAAAAAKFSDAGMAAPIMTGVDHPAAHVEAEPAAPATVGTGLTKAKAAAKRASRAKVVKVDGGRDEAEQLAAAAAVLEKPAKAPRAKKAAKEAEPPFEPVVVKDANNHSAIAVAATARTVELIPMDSAGMTVTKISRDRFAHDYKPVDGYAVGKAAKVYLTQTIAMDPKAKAVLELLASAEADKPIAQGTLVALMSKHDEAATVPVPAAEGTEPAATTAKAPRAARTKTAPADRAAKPLGRSHVDADKVLAAGEVDYKAKVRPNTFRYALMRAIVTAAEKGQKVSEVLGQVVVEGKPGVAPIDVTFAVQNKYVKFA